MQSLIKEYIFSIKNFQKEGNFSIKIYITEREKIKPERLECHTLVLKSYTDHNIQNYGNQEAESHVAIIVCAQSNQTHFLQSKPPQEADIIKYMMRSATTAMMMPNLAFFMHIDRSKLREVRLKVTALAWPEKYRNYSSFRSRTSACPSVGWSAGR